MKIAIMGTGGTGGYFGGLLARAGHDVTFVARGAHLAAIRDKGLLVESVNQGTFTATGRALEDTTGAGEQDLVLFAVKMYQNAAAIEKVRPMMGDGSVVLTLQNGIDNYEQLAAAFGDARVIIGSCYMEGRVVEPGVVSQGGPGAASFGEIQPGVTERCQRLLQVFEDADWNVTLEENMMAMLWKKFSYIAGSAAVCSATNSVYEEMRNVPETRALIQGAIEEALAVGRARGAPIADDSLEWAMDSLDRFPPQGRSSLAKDFLEGRQVELEGMNGTVSRMGRESGVPTPINDALYAILKPWALRIESSLS
ncbi:MAG: 2-dehydropantoate 2-reductase [Dehalococcoidia bacterium]|nr:2-dehydropantoate 2-reductase [Dehalococcoidia bacterium]